MIERILLALLVGGIAGYAWAKHREQTTDDIDWLADWRPNDGTR